LIQKHKRNENEQTVHSSSHCRIEPPVGDQALCEPRFVLRLLRLLRLFVRFFSRLNRRFIHSTVVAATAYTAGAAIHAAFS